MSKLSNNLSEILDIEDAEYENIEEDNSVIEIPEVIENLPTETSPQQKTDERKDYSDARNNYKDLISTGQDALDSLLEIAKNSEKPRDFEVLAKLIDSIGNVNEKFYGLHRKVRDTLDSNPQPQQPINVDKAVFIGTPADLLETLDKK